VVNGDPATNFPGKEVIGVNLAEPIWVYYQHVAQRARSSRSMKATIFIVLFDSGHAFFNPTTAQWIGFLSGAVTANTCGTTTHD
jgi:hypothetical protein